MIFSNSALILPLIFCGKDGNKNDGCNHKIPTVQVYGILIHLKFNWSIITLPLHHDDYTYFEGAK